MKNLIRLLVFLFIVVGPESVSLSEELTGSNEPTFFLFNGVQPKHSVNIDNKYIDNLLSKIGKKLTVGKALSVPVSLVGDDLSPSLGQKLWGFFYSDENGLYISPDEITTVTGYQIRDDGLNGASISFQTNEDLYSLEFDFVYVLCPRDTEIESERHSCYP